MLFQLFIKPYLKILLITLFGYTSILIGLIIFALQLNEEIDDFTLQTNLLYKHPFQVNAAARIARLAVSNSQNTLLYAAINESSIKRESINKEINKDRRKLDTSLTMIESNFLGDMQQVLEARRLAGRLQQERSEIINLLINHQNHKARDLLNAAPIYQQLLERMDYIVEFSSNKALNLVAQAKERGDKSRTQLRLLLLLFASFTLLSGAVTITIVIRSLYRRDQVLRQSHDNLRISATAFESQEGMVVTAADLSIIRVNKAFATITGYSTEEVMGKQPEILFSDQSQPPVYNQVCTEVMLADYWEGEICSKRKSGEEYPLMLTFTAVKNSDASITNYIGTLNDITQSKQAEKKIENLAYYDPLTHLPNRRLLLDRLHHCIAMSSRSGNTGALLFLDLDHFKTLNDTLGHDMGDLLLKQVGERLSKCIRESDTVSRFGGDEFVVILEGLSSQPIDAAEQAKDITSKILSTINAPYQLAAHQHTTTTTSIGVTLFNNHQADVEELLKQADIALYQAKDDGRNMLRFFDPQMQSKISERALLEEQINQAIANQQFQLYYQIQVDNAQQACGAEALIRWLHPERGLIYPLDFIPLAEQNGAIVAIGQWVLESACAQLEIWQNNKITRDLTLSINVSAKQFHQADFIKNVTSLIERHKINPKLLKLELTESMLLKDTKSTIAKMNSLSKMGIQFALDDFGTGYSSLQYLKKLPLYQLKIDKSFVDDIVTNSSEQAIVRTIIAMAHSLGLNVIAEGVEIPEQQQILLNEGCTHYQGYLFSKPVPLGEYEELLKNQHFPSLHKEDNEETAVPGL